jgi:neutral ceramidase
VEAVRRAIEAQRPVCLRFGVGMTQGIAANRREASGVYDARLPFVIAHDADGHVEVVIFSYACHPTILSTDNRLYSGDLIGTASALIESYWDTVALGLTGAAGNISTRFTRRESNVAEVERMSQQLTDVLLTTDTQAIQSNQIDCAQTRLDLALKPTRDKAIVQQELNLVQVQLETIANAAERRIVETAIEGLQLELAAQERPAYLTTEVQVLRLGDVYVTGFPGEMFVEYGLELTQALAPTPVLIAGYANDYIGYVPTPDAHGGYEANAAIVQPTAGSDLLTQAREMVNNWIRKSAKDRPI